MSLMPHEIGYFVLELVAGRPSPQSNGVDVVNRGLMHLADRVLDLEIPDLIR
jgi:hypothetical protein